MDIHSRPAPGGRAPTPVRRGHWLRKGAIAACTGAVLAASLGAGYGTSPAQALSARMVSAPLAATGTSRAPEAPSPSLRGFYTQRLSWGSCAPYALTPAEKTSFRDASLDCASLTVPLDYAHPEGHTAQIGIVRKKATDPARRIGSLITNPGGPGGSGMEVLPMLAGLIGDGELAQRFDLIGFDPRGVGASTPAIRCRSAAERDAERAEPPWLDPSAPAAVAHDKDQARAFAAGCASRTGPEVLAHVGTREVARDLDVLRAALGDDQLTYLGYSYGTSIGTAYAETFPTHVRALVLDGAVNPAQTAKSRTAHQAKGFERAFDAFAADCATHPDCPLGTDPKAADKRLNKLIVPLATHPAPTRDGHRTLSYRDAQTAAIAALYSPRNWALFRAGLTQLAAGDGTILLRIADFYEGRATDGSYSQQKDAHRAIACVDGLEQCQYWPVPATIKPHHPRADGLPTVLIISTTGDPATPYKAGVQLAHDLHGRLLTAEGTQHTIALQGTTCVDDAVTRYLADLELPAHGTRCTIANSARHTNDQES
ncbi:MAG TPA: alpha/beta hydrolase [Pseudonocardiaceae bacterium]|nr:alpha/beta hydrolase [Pseudonocardiaceae bacterium]